MKVKVDVRILVDGVDITAQGHPLAEEIGKNLEEKLLPIAELLFVSLNARKQLKFEIFVGGG